MSFLAYRTGSHDDFLLLGNLLGNNEYLTQQEEVVMTSRPVDQEGHCFLVVDLHPGHVKSLTGMVT